MRLDTETDQVSDPEDDDKDEEEDDDDDEDVDEDDDEDVELDSMVEFYVDSDDEDLDTDLLEDLAINYLADKKKGGRAGKPAAAAYPGPACDAGAAGGQGRLPRGPLYGQQR